MTTEDIQKIFEETDSAWEGDNFVQGVQILLKYFDPKKTRIIGGADHDIVYSVDIEELIKAKVTEEDIRAIAMLNWSFDEEYDCLSCFV